jgi:hypothetical protein
MFGLGDFARMRAGELKACRSAESDMAYADLARALESEDRRRVVRRMAVASRDELANYYGVQRERAERVMAKADGNYRDRLRKWQSGDWP